MIAMMRSTLEARAQAAGLEISWTDAYSQTHTLSDAVLQTLLDAMQPPSPGARGQPQHRANPLMLTANMGDTVCLSASSARAMPAILSDEAKIEYAVRIDERGCFTAPHRYGYYDLHFASSQVKLAVAPPRCFTLADRLADTSSRCWGLSAQVYALRRDGDGGMGDSGAVAELARVLAQAGGDALALSPLHAVRRTASVYSPYTPSHRGFLDWIYADPAQVLGVQAVSDALAHENIVADWQHAQSLQLVDWPFAYSLRRKLWRRLHVQFKQHDGGQLHDDLVAFAQRQGAPLRAHARMVARELLAARSQDAEEVQRGCVIPEAFQDELEFEIFAQWLAARCWRDTQQTALDAGLRLGLIGDLAVGCDPNGSEAWTYRDAALKGVEVGAPPDAFNADGQCWGVTTYSPWGLQASGFRHFIDLLRANMTRGGGLRLDHVAGLYRLWVVPRGRSATQGGYLHYPFQDLLRLLALESWRNQCIVIGEDLGTVPIGLRDRLAASGVLGTDVLLFMRDAKGEFLPPSQWRHDAVATTTTHDLPPLLGWRAALDIEQRSVVQGWPESLRSEQQQERLASVQKLDRAITQWQQKHAEYSPAFPNQACVDYVFDTPAQLVLIPLEDMLNRTEQPNLPGTVHGYPNWRHRLPTDERETLQLALQQVARKQRPNEQPPRQRGAVQR